MTRGLQAPRVPVSYSLEGAAEAVGVGVTAIKAAVDRGELTKHYITPTKPVFDDEELRAWVKKAPTERWEAEA